MSCAAGLGLDGQLSSPSLFLWPSAERAWVGAPPREMKKKKTGTRDGRGSDSGGKPRGSFSSCWLGLAKAGSRLHQSEMSHGTKALGVLFSS